MRKQLLTVCLFFFLFGLNSFVQVDEYALKTVFIERFTSFIEWPSTTASQHPKFVIGYFGKNEYGNALFTLNNKEIKGKKSEVIEIKTVEDLSKCDVVIIMSQLDKKETTVLNAIKTSTALVICDNLSPIRPYASIYFKLENSTLQFSINEKKLAHDEYVVSSKLLKLSKPNL